MQSMRHVRATEVPVRLRRRAQEVLVPELALRAFAAVNQMHHINRMRAAYPGQRTHVGIIAHNRSQFGNHALCGLRDHLPVQFGTSVQAGATEDAGAFLYINHGGKVVWALCLSATASVAETNVLVKCSGHVFLSRVSHLATFVLKAAKFRSNQRLWTIKITPLRQRSA